MNIMNISRRVVIETKHILERVQKLIRNFFMILFVNVIFAKYFEIVTTISFSETLRVARAVGEVRFQAIVFAGVLARESPVKGVSVLGLACEIYFVRFESFRAGCEALSVV